MKYYPIGTHFIIDDKECVVEIHPNEGCTKCHFFNDDHGCWDAKCLKSEREDHLYAIYTCLSTIKEL